MKLCKTLKQLEREFEKINNPVMMTESFRLFKKDNLIETLKNKDGIITHIITPYSNMMYGGIYEIYKVEYSSFTMLYKYFGVLSNKEKENLPESLKGYRIMKYPEHLQANGFERLDSSKMKRFINELKIYDEAGYRIVIKNPDNSLGVDHPYRIIHQNIYCWISPNKKYIKSEFGNCWEDFQIKKQSAQIVAQEFKSFEGKRLSFFTNELTNRNSFIGAMELKKFYKLESCWETGEKVMSQIFSNFLYERVDETTYFQAGDGMWLFDVTYKPRTWWSKIKEKNESL